MEIEYHKNLQRGGKVPSIKWQQMKMVVKNKIFVKFRRIQMASSSYITFGIILCRTHHNNKLKHTGKVWVGYDAGCMNPHLTIIISRNLEITT